MGAELATGYVCPRCGQHHAPLPLSFSAKAPAAVAAISPLERRERIVISPDQCVIDQRRYFLRGRVVVPVIGCIEPFVWGVWAEVNQRDFFKANQEWTTEGREKSEPFQGRLHTELPFYPDTLGLALTVHTQPVGRRPHFVITNQTHPLAVEQAQGVPLRRIEEIAATVRHGANLNA